MFRKYLNAKFFAVIVVFLVYKYFMPDVPLINDLHYKLFNPFVNFQNNKKETSFKYPNNIILCDSLLAKVQTHDLKKKLSKNNSDQPRVILVYSDGALGETNASLRIADVLTKKNVEWAIITNKKYKLFKSRHISVIEHLNPDFVISLNIDNKPATNFQNYLFLHEGQEVYLNEKKRYLVNLPLYSGYLIVGERYEKLETYLQSLGNSFKRINVTFSSSFKKFEALTYHRLFYCGANWDKFRGKKYKSLYKKLDKNGYFDVYGPPSAWSNLSSYHGFLPPGDRFLTEAIKKSGVVIVLHSDIHLSQNVPTSRIFEAVSASAVVICDLLPFAIKNFGDSFLYVDQKKSADEMFKQIDQHMKWIKENPLKAQEMAKRAHEIFTKHYTLEAEVQKILDFHKSF